MTWPGVGWLVSGHPAWLYPYSNINYEDQQRAHVIEPLRARPTTDQEVRQLPVNPGSPLSTVSRTTIGPAGSTGSINGLVALGGLELVYKLPTHAHMGSPTAGTLGR